MAIKKPDAGTGEHFYVSGAFLRCMTATMNNSNRWYIGNLAMLGQSKREVEIFEIEEVALIKAIGRDQGITAAQHEAAASDLYSASRLVLRQIMHFVSSQTSREQPFQRSGGKAS